jgi:DNA-directed RNA polymerase subunit RPC12/RpoP
LENETMATYECNKCGMAVNTSCAKCDTPLVDASITRDDGSAVQIAKCPTCAGKIKSPLCCGQDMVCAV